MNGEDRYRTEVSKLLLEFGTKGLKAPEQFIEEGTQLAHKVFLKLQQKSKRFTVAEPRFAGSFGKKTEVIHPDLDLVVVVNSCEPPYDEVLDEFEDILLLNESELKIRPGSIVKKTSFSVQFVFFNGIEVDLLPAANLEPSQVYEIIGRNPKEYYSYSSCLVGKQLAFMKSHTSSFLHSLVRLVKFWFKSLLFKDKKVYGGSTMMELIGVAAAEEDERIYDKPDIIRAFNTAMDWISKLNTLKLAFEENPENQWIRVNTNMLTLTNKQNLVPGIVGTTEILKRNFFIIEPANPYNDLLDDKDPLVIERLMKFANVTKQRLACLMKGDYATYSPSANVVEIDIMRLFEPQPISFIAEFPSGATKDLLLGYDYPYSSSHGDMKVRNEKVFKKPEVKDFLEAMKWNLTAAARAATNGNSSKSSSTSDVRKSVQNFIKSSFSTELKSSNEKHENYDVTLTIPYSINDVGYAIKCSFRWKH